MTSPSKFRLRTASPFASQLLALCAVFLLLAGCGGGGGDSGGGGSASGGSGSGSGGGNSGGNGGSGAGGGAGAPATPGSFSFEKATYDAVESDGMVQIVIQSNKTPKSPDPGTDLQYFEVRIRSGSATRDVDYDSINLHREVFVAAGWSVTTALPLLSDGAAESSETIELEIYDKATGAVVSGVRATTVINVADDDGGPGSASPVSLVWEYKGLKSQLTDQISRLEYILTVPFLAYTGGKPTWYVVERSDTHVNQLHYTALTTSDYSQWSTNDITVDGTVAGSEWRASETTEKRFVGAPRTMVEFRGQLYGATQYGTALHRSALMTSPDAVTWTSHAPIKIGADRYVFRTYPFQAGESCFAPDICPVIEDMAVVGPLNDQTLYLHIGGRLLRTKDGAAWSLTAASPAECINSNTRFLVANNVLLLAGGGVSNVCRSVDGGTTWTKITNANIDLNGNPMPVGPPQSQFGAAPRGVAQTLSGSYFIGTTGHQSRPIYLRSTDGLNWTAYKVPVPTCPGNSPASDSVDWALNKWVYLRATCQLEGSRKLDRIAGSADGNTWTFSGVVGEYDTSPQRPIPTFYANTKGLRDANNFHAMLTPDLATTNGSLVMSGTTYDSANKQQTGLVRVRF